MCLSKCNQGIYHSGDTAGLQVKISLLQTKQRPFFFKIQTKYRPIFSIFSKNTDHFVSLSLIITSFDLFLDKGFKNDIQQAPNFISIDIKCNYIQKTSIFSFFADMSVLMGHRSNILVPNDVKTYFLFEVSLMMNFYLN